MEDGMQNHKSQQKRHNFNYLVTCITWCKGNIDNAFCPLSFVLHSICTQISDCKIFTEYSFYISVA